jgi:hypothetical protein
MEILAIIVFLSIVVFGFVSTAIALYEIVKEWENDR